MPGYEPTRRPCVSRNTPSEVWRITVPVIGTQSYFVGHRIGDVCMIRALASEHISQLARVLPGSAAELPNAKSAEAEMGAAPTA